MVTWDELLDGTDLAHLGRSLAQLDPEALARRSRYDRQSVLTLLKTAGVDSIAHRQTITNMLAAHRRRITSPSLRERVSLVVLINVHELPSFVLLQLKHIRDNLRNIPHRIILNCNREMLVELRNTPACELCHPTPIEKRRHHGSLLEGIMANVELAMRRWDLEHVLILSSRSWFRRPLSPDDIEAGYASQSVPLGTRCADLQYDKRTGLRWMDSEPEVLLTGVDIFQPYRETKLAINLLTAGCALLHGPHEGLVLEQAACIRALEAFAGDVGRDLYSTEAAVEEFALQSLAHSYGLRHSQLSDMGRPGDGQGTGAIGDHLPPITKTLRYDAQVPLLQAECELWILDTAERSQAIAHAEPGELF